MALEEQILNHKYQLAPRRIEPLGGAGGFSGAQLWKVTTEQAVLCLRRWPAEHPSPRRLAWIHAVLQRAERAGFTRAPVPIWPTGQRQSFVDAESGRWQLEPWMPGAADYHESPRPARLAAALETLAEFHRAVAGPVQRGLAPGIAARSEQLRDLQPSLLSRLQAAARTDPSSELSALLTRYTTAAARCTAAAETALQATLRVPFRLQPCIRDIWSEHVLFEGNRVSGIVDFGAMRIETVATDIARLLGSLAGNDSARWSAGLAAYEKVRPLEPVERAAAGAIDAANRVLSPASWFRWLLLEKRQFEDPLAARARLRGLIERLEDAAG